MTSNASPIGTVDTTSPFRSVKEAIATYGEQFLARKLAPTSDQMKAVDVREDFVMLPPKSGVTVEDGQRVDLRRRVSGVGYDGDYDDVDDQDHGNKDFDGFANKLKKLEDELQETKFELKMLKEKECETEVALASLNAEFHKNMSKIARMEAVEAGNMNKYTSKSSIHDREISREYKFDAERRARDVRKITENRPTLEQVLSFGACEGYFMNSKKVAKKKPVVPLITDIFAWKKKSPWPKEKDDLSFLSPLYSSSTYLQ